MFCTIYILITSSTFSVGLANAGVNDGIIFPAIMLTVSPYFLRSIIINFHMSVTKVFFCLIVCASISLIVVGPFLSKSILYTFFCFHRLIEILVIHILITYLSRWWAPMRPECVLAWSLAKHHPVHPSCQDFRSPSQCKSICWFESNENDQKKEKRKESKRVKWMKANLCKSSEIGNTFNGIVRTKQQLKKKM